MRFLLYASTKKPSKHWSKIASAALESSSTFAVPQQQQQPQQQPQQQAWGQQCSPQCGCVLRFECTTTSTKKNESSAIITSAQYHAKRVVTTKHINGHLEPLTAWPLMVPCTCQTLHTLAQQVVQYMVHQKMTTVQQSTEYTGVRSSLAMQHAVLTAQNLPAKDTTCFDLVEEALIAMTKGYLPNQRSTTMSFPQALAQRYTVPVEVVSSTKTGTPSTINMESVTRYGRSLRRSSSSQSFGQDESISVTSPRSMSALTMFDLALMEEFHLQDKEDSIMNPAATVPPSTASMDWESYVDTLYHRDEDQMA